MPRRHRHYLKAAQSIHRQLTGTTAELAVPDLPRQLWQHVRVTANCVAKAQVWGWQQAARVKSRELLNGLDELQRAVNLLIGELQDRLQPLPVATPAELYADLVALEQERFEVQIDLDQHQLCVTTEPIELERIHLGRFAIRLDWQPRHATRHYRIVPLEPNPAAANDAVTHPHVNDEILCEGDGRASIARALATGRLYDFFTIVDRLLHTYAPGRAYVELDQWHGFSCHDCGCVVNEEENYSCSRCEETICADCLSCCSHCDQSCCSRCSDSCRLCDEPTCSSCLDRCHECKSLVCPHCVTNNLCIQCHENQIEPDPEPEEFPDQTPAAANPTLHADGLGQTDVPA